MNEFTIEEFADYLAGLAAEMPVLETAILEHIGNTVKEAAKDKIGEYQSSAGPFRAWESLADTTMAQRVQYGYSEDEPLLRSGSLRASIHYRIVGPVVEIGSDDPIAEYQEFGTERIPARSFLGGAAFEQAPKLIAESGAAMAVYLTTGKV